MVNSKIQLPVLQDDVVKLQPLIREDFNDLLELACDPRVWEQHPAKERASSAGFTKFFNESLTERSSYVIRDQNDNVIGMTSFYEYDDYHKMISIGFTFLGYDFWGKGYNDHVKKLMIQFAFNTLEVDHVLFHVDENNLRSQHALDKLGIKKINDVHTVKRGAEERHNLLFMISR